MTCTYIIPCSMLIIENVKPYLLLINSLTVKSKNCRIVSVNSTNNRSVQKPLIFYNFGTLEKLYMCTCHLHIPYIKDRFIDYYVFPIVVRLQK